MVEAVARPLPANFCCEAMLRCSSEGVTTMIVRSKQRVQTWFAKKVIASKIRGSQQPGFDGFDSTLRVTAPNNLEVFVRLSLLTL